MAGKPQHGESRSAEYRAWQTARLRCTDPSNQAWSNYGGRGITMCLRWLNSVADFIADMGRKPSKAHELDREDNDRGYEPGNCRWVVRKINDRNRRSNRMITIDGQTKTLAEWCELRGLPRSTIQKRLKAGWTAEKALTQPIGPSGPKALNVASNTFVAAIMADAAPKTSNQAETRRAQAV